MKTILAALLLAASFSVSAAERYPQRPVRMILPNPAGGANDVIGRLVAQKLAERLGQQIVIDNRGGAGGAIGAELAADAAPDGYTLLAATFATHTTIPHLQKKVRYDPLKNFAPVALFAVQYSMLSAHPGFAPGTVKELIAYAKAKPGAINYGSAGPGSTSHFTGLMFAKLAGIQVTIVPYKGGAQAISAMLAGEVNINFGPIPATAAQIRAGRLKAIAVSGEARSIAMPDVPTVAESGLPGFSQSAWVGLVAPARTPQDILKQLHALANEALQTAELRQQIVRAGAEPAPVSRAEFEKFMRNEYQRYGGIIKDLGLGPT